MSSSEDSYEYECYSIESYRLLEGPPLIKKKSRLLMAAVQNDVETLRELLDSPKWYKVTDKYGYGLLHIAVIQENKDVFDYLLSIEDFPLDAINYTNQTALVLAMFNVLPDDIDLSEYFIWELIKKGADIHRTCFEGNTLLHCALERDLIEIAKILIEEGVDVNIQNDDGYTPLHMCCRCSPVNLIEGISMLLCHGADPLIRDRKGFTPFDLVLALRHDMTMVAQENLLYYTLDEYTRYTIPVDALFAAAETKSPLFYQIVDNVANVDFDSCVKNHCLTLFVIKPEYLKVLIEKFDYVIRQILLTHSKIYYFGDFRPVSLENFHILEESQLKSEMINFCSYFHNGCLLSNIIGSKMSESVITELVCYLLSYGMGTHEIHLEIIFRKFGYNELFKILLHMDITMQVEQPRINTIPRLIYDIHFDIQQIIENPFVCSVMDLNLLLPLFALSKLKNFDACGDILQARYVSIAERVKNQPQIPLLIELARNVFRRYFIRRFHITTSRQFYTLLKALPISVSHEKIITFETALY